MSASLNINSNAWNVISRGHSSGMPLLISSALVSADTTQYHIGYMKHTLMSRKKQTFTMSNADMCLESPFFIAMSFLLTTAMFR